MNPTNSNVIDVHMHVGLLGDKWPNLGHFLPSYRKDLVYKIFLLYVRIKEDQVTDQFLFEKTIEAIATSDMDKVVCLALDHVYDEKGTPRPELSNMWVDNDYIVHHLMTELPDKILLGASVHPYDPKFAERVYKYADKGAVLLKWLPSAQYIDLAEDRTREAMIALAKAGPGGKPLPLLLHIGTELAIPTTNERTNGYNCLSWTWKDKFSNFFRGKKKWYIPRLEKIHDNLNVALQEGTIIIFAHCGLPYFVGGLFGGIFEHSEFKTVCNYLNRTNNQEFSGMCYTDLSAICTPFRKKYFKEIGKLPDNLLLFGSDFPTPAFELSADIKEFWDDFKAVLKGDFHRVIIPQDNLIDVVHRELKYFFPGHPMFTNFNDILL